MKEAYHNQEKVFTALYWFCKQEVAHFILNSLLEMLELLRVKEVKQFK